MTATFKTELEVARAIAAGELPSPKQYFNAAFYAVRVSGTGAAWRDSVNEFVWREPAIWLGREMIERVRGLPVVWMHPAKGTLDTKTFGNTCVGTIIFAWARGSELWGIARILDADAAALLDSGKFDTSPAVICAPDGAETLTLAEGETLLVEGAPALFDHLALVAAGVWSKGRDDIPGVEISTPERTAA